MEIRPQGGGTTNIMKSREEWTKRSERIPFYISVEQKEYLALTKSHKNKVWNTYSFAHG